MSEIAVYRIAAVCVRLDYPCPVEESTTLAPYRVADNTPPDVTVTVCVADLLTEPTAPPLHESETLYICEESGCLTRYFYSNRTAHTPPYAILRECSPSRRELCYARTQQNFFTHSNNFFSCLGLEHLLLQNGAAILHASYLETPRGALLFTGPSGIGKSTQAALWEAHAAARLVNGDRVALRFDGTSVCAFGLPIAGSSHCFRNVTLPVTAIVRLDQAAENVATPLSPSAAFRLLYEQTTVNHWNADAVTRAAALIGEVCERVPVWHYACRKQPDAFTTLYRVLFSEEHS